MSDEQIKIIKLTENVLQKENIDLKKNNYENNIDIEYDPRYKSEYKIMPKINKSIYKLDPMLIIGIGIIVSLLLYLGYKYSDKEETSK